MKVLAINFGHDASFALFENNELTSYVELERITRLKHTVGISDNDIQDFLKVNGLELSEISLIALAGTQWYKAKHSSGIVIEKLSTQLDDLDSWKKMTLDYTDYECGGTDNWYDFKSHEKRLNGTEQTEFPIDVFKDFEEKGLGELKIINEVIPYKISLLGNTINAIFVPHQIAHASYGGFYREESDATRLVVCHDGGWPHIKYNSGGVFLVSEEGVRPVIDPRLALGQLYQIMGERAGFKPAEAPGKLMGLAAYGIVNAAILAEIKNTYYENLPISKSFKDADEFHSAFKLVTEKIVDKAKTIILREKVEDYYFDFEDEKFSIGIATYTQKLVEQVWIETIGPLIEKIEDELNIEDEISFVGGFSLNCPSNSLLQANIQSRVKPLAGGADMGVSIGAGAYASSKLSKLFPINKNKRSDAAAYPPRPTYKSVTSIDISKLKEVQCDNLIKFYVDKLLSGKVFCHVEGDSEVGPRALGHRSIIAHGVSTKIRDKINIHKGREMWRPLAPIIRKEDFSEYFFGSDNGEMSDFMLNTYYVKNRITLGGVTHADGTARVQTVKDGTIYDLLTELKRRKEVPVVINTSFNVAGEPLVESYENAQNSFLKLKLDYIYIDGKFYEEK